MASGYETPSDDDSAGTMSPTEVESREAPAGSKRRMAPSGSSQREAKSRRTGEAGGMTAPGQGQGQVQSSNGPRAPASGSNNNPNAPPGYNELGGMGIGVQGHSVMMEDAYGPRHAQKREELADQKLMDELKKDLGDPLIERPPPSQSANAARSPPPTA